MASPNPTEATSESQSDATKRPPSPATNDRAPAPKGSAGGKPTTSATPLPKGQKGTKPTIDNGAAPAPKQPRTPNPTYANATQFVTQYFRREAELSDLFWKAASAGFEAFKIRTSVEYNKTSSLAFQLFEAAIGAVNGGQAILSILEQVKTGEHIKKLVEQVEKIKKWTERAGAVKEGVEKARTISEAAESESEAQESGDFKIETVNSLVELSADSMIARWGSEDRVNDLLRGVEYADPSQDLEKVVAQALGAMPNAKMVEAIKEDASKNFEYRLYHQYYAESAKAVLVLNVDDDDQSTTFAIEHVPDKVLERIFELGFMDDFKRGVGASHTETRHQRWRGSKF